MNEMLKGIFVAVTGGLIVTWILKINSGSLNKLLALLQQKVTFSISILSLLITTLIIIVIILIYVITQKRKLKILKAIYGNPPEKIDNVTSALKRNIVNNKLKMEVSNKMKGYHDDPDKGNAKSLTIEYKFKNKEHKKTYKEGEIFHLP